MIISPITLMAELGDHLTAKREMILQDWRNRVAADPELTSASALSRSQLNDHIPEILKAFEDRLRAFQGAGMAPEAPQRNEQKNEAIHGAIRWRQGYRFKEVLREWGHLQLCLLEELNAFGVIHRDFDRWVLGEASRQLVVMTNEAVAESAAQYEQMQRAEAAGHIDELKATLTVAREIEHRRSALIHQAVHDLGNNFNSVGMTARLLGEKEIVESERLEFASILQQSMGAVTEMLGELMELARLEAGHERREIGSFDAYALVADLCGLNRANARDRGLFLNLHHASSFVVAGDAGKVRRVLQNLLRNALKYTERGGVNVRVDQDDMNWSVTVADTGPGLGVGANTAAAAQVGGAQAGDSAAPRPQRQPPGEGIGLSIVKRLCDLLDARLETRSVAGEGTTFRVSFPRRY